MRFSKINLFIARCAFSASWPVRRCVQLFRLRLNRLVATILIEPALLSMKRHALLEREALGDILTPDVAGKLAMQLRRNIRHLAGLPSDAGASIEDLLDELAFIQQHAALIKPILIHIRGKRVLYAGQSYYNTWHLSRVLRDHGWKADVLNWDMNPSSQIYYHGEDFRFSADDADGLLNDLRFYVSSLYGYDVFHFSNMFGICFGFRLQNLMKERFGMHSEIHLLKSLGKQIAYSLTGCADGVTQTSFSQWGPHSVCSICRWRDYPEVCSDAKSIEWGTFRNAVADYQCNFGGNRVDYNIVPTLHEAPQFYCLDPALWDPALPIPDSYQLPPETATSLKLYHAIGNRKERTDENGVNIKSSHIYLPLIDKLRDEGIDITLLEPTAIPNKEVRFLQMQADIFLEMLTFGWFGANAREAMMLGKPVVCFIRPEWLESVRKELPEYAEELPIVNTTPETVEQVLRDLIANPEKRREIGERSRAFAIKWHSTEAAGRHFDHVYSELLRGNPLLLEAYA